MSLHPTDASALLVDTAARGGSAAVATIVGGDSGLPSGRRIAWSRSGPEAESVITGTLATGDVDEAAISLLAHVIDDPRSGDGLRRLEVGSSVVEVYVEVRRPVLDLIVVGAGHIAQPMAHLGAILGFRVTVLDDRPDFATRERFPDAERLVRADFSDPFAEVPLHERSHILLVTRGHKYDYECLIRALRHAPPPAYIGMIGSRRRVRATFVQLLDEGIPRAHLELIHAPVGLDIGAETPEEIAVAVAAELVMTIRGGTGAALKGVERVAERFFPEDAGS